LPSKSEVLSLNLSNAIKKKKYTSYMLKEEESMSLLMREMRRLSQTARGEKQSGSTNSRLDIEKQKSDLEDTGNKMYLNIGRKKLIKERTEPQ
jgi:hypothetical protein